MKKDRLKGPLTAFEEALGEVIESLSYLDGLKGKKMDLAHRIASDAVVKRYEVAFEYAWKLMKSAAEFQGSEAPGPRPAIQEALRYGWIGDPEFWAVALDARNGSVHDYFGISREDYIDIVRRFVEEASAFAGKVKALESSR